MHYEAILRALHCYQVRYLVVGGLAVNLYGIPRLTMDLDIIVDQNPENIGRLLSALAAEGYIPRLPIDPKVLGRQGELLKLRETRPLSAFTFLHHRPPAGELDVVLEFPFIFDSAYERRSVLKIGDYDISLVSIDDLQRMKEALGRAQDIADRDLLAKVRRENGRADS